MILNLLIHGLIGGVGKKMTCRFNFRSVIKAFYGAAIWPGIEIVS